MAGAPHFCRGGFDRLENVLIAGATAGISRNRLSDLLLIGVRVVIQELHRRKHKTRRAITALETVAVTKCLLNRMKLTVFLQTFVGGEFRAVGLYPKHPAG